MILMIDNYDSFTYNLVQYLGELGEELAVKRNDEITLEEIEAMAPTYLMISPGPCTPNEAGISLKAIEYFAGKIPILGVCLGHQAIAQVFGGEVIRAKTLMHGKTSSITHEGMGLFSDLPSPIDVTRYHSLIVDEKSFPDQLQVTAWTSDGEIMALKHKTLPIEGVQFHPESIMSQFGKEMLKNFLVLYKPSRSKV
ncbi:aminodeoxychorismate/anthranilate synthase component II [Gottfriedia solisilvae]|uniref:Glutamine amidotransferase n=1 Tax=Gottfriedia solisilvae TaxID=1516104 RepID=A0A8J3AXF8_9BACI|nr:aminodeoxychorismate/anthranilate synthase component II [Gottfriedia solisilvae]GGI18431.1 glutamine amidotransferase [Gottfriedia solisilvae]